MAFKLAITAGHALNTPGKRCMKALDPNETREWQLNDRVADRIEKLLSEYDGIQILRTDDTTGRASESLTARTNAANNFGADFYLSIHHNAGIGGGTGGGIETYIYNGSVSQATRDWQNELYNELIKFTGLKGNRSDGTRAANFHEVRETRMPAVLLELGYMDSKTDVPIILTDDFAFKCAQACVNVIVKRAGLKKKAVAPTPAPTPTVVKTYEVVTTINKYSSAGDASAQKNSKGSFKAGVYYIYTKYPNGYSGMFNITTDKSGNSPDGWINPKENVKPVVKEETKKEEVKTEPKKEEIKVEPTPTPEVKEEPKKEEVKVEPAPTPEVKTEPTPEIKEEEVKVEPTPAPVEPEVEPTPEPEIEEEPVEPTPIEPEIVPEPEVEDKNWISIIMDIIKKIIEVIIPMFKKEK